MAYEKNILAMVGGEDTPAAKPIVHDKTNLDEAVNIRDVLSGMVAKGYTNLTDPDAKNNFAYLAGIVGRQTAQQMVNHIILFNQRDDTKGLNAEGRLRQFYEMGSNDPHIDNIIKGAGSLGTGPIAAARESSDVLNMTTMGKGFTKGKGNPDATKTTQDIASSITK